MNLGTIYRVGVVVLVVEVVAAIWGLAIVGIDTTVPMHWGLDGEVNGYASALVAFSAMPLTTLGLLALFAAVPRIEPRRANLERSASAYRTVAVAVLVLMGVIQIVVVLAAVGRSIPMATVMGIGIGALFAIMGNVLTTVRSNFMFGVRTPWTLTSDLAWDRTHRVVGRLFVLAGITVILLSLTGQLALVVWVLLAWVAVILAVALAYSYRVWKSDPNRRTSGSAT